MPITYLQTGKYPLLIACTRYYNVPSSTIIVMSLPFTIILVLSVRSYSLAPPVTITHTLLLDIRHVVIQWSYLLLRDTGRLI